MNQDKLEVVKQEMARLNVNTLGISELKWMWMGKFSSDDYYCGQESLRRNEVLFIVNKRVWSQTGAISKMTKWSWFIPRQTIQHYSNPSHALITNAKEAEVKQFYEDLQDLLELTPEKDVLFIIGYYNVKVGSQKIPGKRNNRQVWP